jgi:hypothetical protein
MTEAVKVTRFAAYTTTDSAWHDVYTVPAGKRIAVTQVEIASISGGAQTAEVSMVISGVRTVFAVILTAAATSSKSWSGRVVLYEGDVISLGGSSSGHLDWSVSGYLYYV